MSGCFIPILADLIMILTRFALFEALANSATLITPNARLTKSITEAYDASQTKAVWPKATILPFNQWLEQLWDTYCVIDDKTELRLLTERQSDLIWLDLVTDHSSGFYNADALAKKIKQAFGHCLAWQVDPFSDEFKKNEETIFFRNLLTHYQSISMGNISPSELLTFLIERIDEGKLSFPKRIVFAYFDDFTPLQEAFIQRLKELPSTEVLFFDESIEPENIYRVETLTEQDELKQVIVWIKAQLALGKKEIGVVVPNLQNLRDSFEKTLLLDFKKEAFNLSLGNPLSQFSIVNNALALLSLQTNSISLEQLHLLCHSTFIGKFNEESNKRWLAYQAAQRTTEKMFYVNLITSQVLKGTWLANALDAFLARLHSHKTQNLSAWSETFIEVLALMGFPGDKSLSSDEYQVHVRFLHSLTEFGQLTDANSLFSKADALNLLMWHLNQLIFQPKAHESSVQFIGFLEALGLQFDALWVMDMSEAQLPKKLNPSAFIPIEIQRNKHMPHASDDRELSLANKHVKRLSQSALEVVFSHHIDHEGLTRQVSPLIAHYSLLPLEPLPTQAVENDALEVTPVCTNAPLLTSENIRGGSYLIKEQAQCPFRAFSKFRLALKEPRQNLEGLDPLDRGVLIHRIMELFWQEVGCQEKLLALEATNDLDKLSRKVINNAMGELKQQKPHTCTALFMGLEKKRLKRMLDGYLVLEKERPPFTVIHIEFESEFVISDLNLRLRVDRIDELENGDWLVIDYKTGTPTLSSLFEERLTEPQLPMYVLTQEKIKAVVYGQLQQRSIRNKGISQDELDIKGIVTIEKNQSISWQYQRLKWQEAIAELTDGFLSGDIIAKPATELVCLNCTYETLCGIRR